MNGQMIPGGIAGGAPQQAAPQMPPPQMPPQQAAPQMPSQGGMPQMGGLGAMMPQLPQTNDAQLRLNQAILLYQQDPNYHTLGLVTDAKKAVELQQAVKQQAAMLQGQQAMAQGTVADQVMSSAAQLDQGIGGQQYGYAGGGLVAFAVGGSVSELYDRKAALTQQMRAAADARERAVIAQQIADIDRQIAGAQSQDIRSRPFFTSTPGPSQQPSDAEPVDELSRLMALAPDQNSELARLKALSAPSAPPGAGAPAVARPVPRPGAGAPSAPSTTTPFGPPRMTDADRMAMLEPEYEAQSKRMQEFYQKQGAIDPELARLRQAAYESSEGITKRREQERAAMLQAAQDQLSAPLMDNQEALFRAAGSTGGAKTLGEALANVSGAFGQVRGEQRKAFESAQKIAREEQNAIDTLKQALAEKRVADRSGDVDRIRTAELNVEQARGALLDKRFAVRKEVAGEADKAAHRQSEERKAGAAELTARAAMLAAQNRGAAASQISPYQMAQLRDKAIDNLSKTMGPLVAKARIEAGKTGRAFDEQAFRDALIQQEIARLLGQPVPYSTPGASPGAAGQPKVLDWNQISAPKS